MMNKSYVVWMNKLLSLGWIRLNFYKSLWMCVCMGVSVNTQGWISLLLCGWIRLKFYKSLCVCMEVYVCILGWISFIPHLPTILTREFFHQRVFGAGVLLYVVSCDWLPCPLWMTQQTDNCVWGQLQVVFKGLLSSANFGFGHWNE